MKSLRAAIRTLGAKIIASMLVSVTGSKPSPAYPGAAASHRTVRPFLLRFRRSRNAAPVNGEVHIEMGLRSPRFVASTLLTVVLSVGLTVFGWLWGVPRWNVAFDGMFAPWVSAYGGWAVSIGFVALGSIMVAACIVTSWIQRTYHYLALGVGAVAVLTFIALGLPATVLTQIKDGVRLVIVGLCGLMVLAIFASALRARLTRRFRT